MKTLRLISACIGIAATAALAGAETPKSTPRVEIIFDHPENFTDVKDANLPTDRGRDAILGQIRSFLVERAEPMVPDGETFTMTFTDIDLAGDFEPWRGGQWDNVRIVKSIYPPSFKFTYTVTDSSGKVVKQGSEHLRDLDFLMRITTDPSDSLRYEKQILDDWLRSNLRDLGRG
jgi:Protein of unknown function (DUF3016)